MQTTKSNNNHTSKNPRIMECVCDHSYQDNRYGKSQRVMNPFANGYRCTVCNREHETKA